jgi:hypothetical protein
METDVLCWACCRAIGYGIRCSSSRGLSVCDGSQIDTRDHHPSPAGTGRYSAARSRFVSQDNDVATASSHLSHRTRHHRGERGEPRPLHPRIVEHAPWDEELVTKDRAVMHAE